MTVLATEGGGRKKTNQKKKKQNEEETKLRYKTLFINQHQNVAAEKIKTTFAIDKATQKRKLLIDG